MSFLELSDSAGFTSGYVKLTELCAFVGKSSRSAGLLSLFASQESG